MSPALGGGQVDEQAAARWLWLDVPSFGLLAVDACKKGAESGALYSSEETAPA